MDNKIIMKGVGDLKPYGRNPRKNEQAVEAVAASIREFGFKVPIIITAAGEIIAGHTRLKAAKTLGITEVPCIVADDLTPQQVKAFRLADNKVGELAGWDFDLLALELEEITDFDMEQFGFGDMDAPKVHEDEFDDSVPVQPITCDGDLWVLGRHRLLCGDATLPDAMSQLMGDIKADMLLTDPPYNVDYTGGTDKGLKIQNDKMDDTKFREFLRAAFFCAKSALKPGGAFYIWHADSEGYNFRGACKDIGWKIRQCLIWKKNSLVLGRQDYQWIHEPCLYGWESVPTGEREYEMAHDPCLYGWNDGASHEWLGNRRKTTVLEFDRPQRSAEHPTMKPVLLFDYLIQNSAMQRAVVPDPFLGSGTTVATCEQNGRTCFGMELDPKYCDVIARRYITLAGTEGVHLFRNGEEVMYGDMYA